jgi:hypothetical protein
MHCRLPGSKGHVQMHLQHHQYSTAIVWDAGDSSNAACCVSSYEGLYVRARSLHTHALWWKQLQWQLPLQAVRRHAKAQQTSEVCSTCAVADPT